MLISTSRQYLKVGNHMSLIDWCPADSTPGLRVRYAQTVAVYAAYLAVGYHDIKEIAR